MPKKMNLASVIKKNEELSKKEMCSTNAGVDPDPKPDNCSCTGRPGDGVDDWDWLGGDCTCSIWTFFGIAWG